MVGTVSGVGSTNKNPFTATAEERGALVVLISNLGFLRFLIRLGVDFLLC